MNRLLEARLGRRALVGGAGMLGLSLAGARATVAHNTQIVLPAVLSDMQGLPAELVIDLSGPPDHLDPALTYSVLDWSIMHSVYDALIDFGEDGSLVPLAAEAFETDDAMTFRVTLREGVQFHDGTPVTTAAISRAVTHLQETESQIASLFQGISEVREIDDLHAEIVTAEPSGWLPSQIAVWLVLYPESATPDSLATHPVGSGPYVFESYDPGSSITLVRNEAYTWESPKGTPLAERVIYRFVPESATRIADLSTGTAHIITDVPVDQMQVIADAGRTAVTTPILGTTFIRIATDVAPFDDSRVRQALNYAVDAQTIADAIVGPDAQRLASFFPDPRGLGFDSSLQPFVHDPDRARALLEEAGLPDGIDAEIEIVASSRTDVVEAIVAQLQEVGIRLKIVASELAAFNQGWPDAAAPALRYATWRPMYDPHTFLSLVVDSAGFLSRFENANVDELIRAAAIEPGEQGRAQIYEQLGALLQEEPAGIYLWNVTANYGVSDEFLTWTPRGDQYVVPTTQQGETS